LILAAVIVGVLLLSRGFDEDGGVVAAGPDDTTDTTAADGDSTDTTAVDDDTTDTTAADGSTDTTAPATTVRPAEETRFIVLNGTTTNGAASSLSSQLSALGYVPGT